MIENIRELAERLERERQMETQTREQLAEEVKKHIESVILEQNEKAIAQITKDVFGEGVANRAFKNN